MLQRIKLFSKKHLIVFCSDHLIFATHMYDLSEDGVGKGWWLFSIGA